MSTLTTEFAFELGQTVYFRNAENNRNSTPKPYTVWERTATECHGGIQRFYILGRHPELQLIPEIALTADRQPYDATSDKERKHSWETAFLSPKETI